MYGYTITINGRTTANERDLSYKNIICSNFMIKKFEQDKIFKQTGDFIVILDGIILNKKQIIA